MLGDSLPFQLFQESDLCFVNANLVFELGVMSRGNDEPPKKLQNNDSS